MERLTLAASAVMPLSPVPAMAMSCGGGNGKAGMKGKKGGGCCDKMPVATGDVPYLRGVERTLNHAVRRAAAATGATYVNLGKVSEGHDACQPMGVRWVEPVLQGTNPVVVHPNALGEQHLAKRAMKVLGLS